jgi:hypothetical protein
MKLLSHPVWKKELLTRLANVRPDTPRQWGTMTAPQMICHLSDCFLGVMGEKPMEIPVRRSLLALTKPLVLYMPFRWPPGVATRPELDQAIGGTPPSDFALDAARLRASIDRFTSIPRTFQFRTHPMFGEMSQRDWMRWGYLHTDHHLRQFGK